MSVRQDFLEYAAWRRHLRHILGDASGREAAVFGVAMVEVLSPVMERAPAGSLDAAGVWVRECRLLLDDGIVGAAPSLPRVGEVRLKVRATRDEWRRHGGSGFADELDQDAWGAARWSAIVTFESFEFASERLGWCSGDPVACVPPLIAAIDDAITRTVILHTHTIPDGADVRASRRAIEGHALRRLLQQFTGMIIPRLRHAPSAGADAPRLLADARGVGLVIGQHLRLPPRGELG